ncbi:MAG TPA: type II secretion system F family protein [Phycisphaerales bacterium]|nr:type II secretion system F family protein [Phycisphaerales bacterium]HMP37807.1 type II secretion system F family protein [Phycisphaerales bacterium]
MTSWQYTAVAVGGSENARRRGVIAGDSSAEVRAALRRVGLVVVDIRELPSRKSSDGSDDGLAASWLRGRRKAERAEFHDSLALLIGSGLPMSEALDAMLGDERHRPAARVRMIGELRDSLRSGRSLAEAMAPHPGWFDPIERAMVEAGQRGGTLAQVLRDLTERHEQSANLGQKLLAALAYPCAIALLGTAVAVFLGVKTLPELSQLLVDAGLEVPGLTAGVIAIVGFVVRFWWAVAIGAVIVVGAAIGVVSRVIAAEDSREGSRSLAAWMDRVLPRVVRRLALASLCQRLAELIRTGVPLTESLRVLAPTVGTMTIGLRAALRRVAQRIEQGSSLADALAEEEKGEPGLRRTASRWFEPEMVRLVEVGETGGELDVVLERLGRRYERSGRRLIDRLAALAEPAVILILAVLVGIVVMAAVLPLVRLQEVIG